MRPSTSTLNADSGVAEAAAPPSAGSDASTEAQLAIVGRVVERHAKDLHRYVDSGSVPGLAKFQRESFGPASRQRDEQFARWLYLERPGNELIYCEKNGEVVGSQGAIAVDLQAGDATVPAAFAIDLRVRPEWKMKGVGVALIGTLLRRYDVVVGLGISDEAETMFLRQGWVDLGHTDRLIKPLTLNGLLGSRELLPAAIRKLVGPLVRWLLSGIDALLLARDRSLPPGTRIARLERFEPEHDAWLAALELEGSVHPRRDSAYLNWRYFGSAAAGKYLVYAVWAEGRLAGYMAVAVGVRDDRRVLALADVACEDRYVGALLATAIAKARAAGADAIYYQGVAPRLKAMLKRRLFVDRWHGSRFMAFTRRSDLRKLLSERENWRICLADSDMAFAITYSGPRTRASKASSDERKAAGGGVEPFFFGSPGRRLLGVYHPPQRAARDEGLVICPPLFAEYLRSHASLRRLAVTAAERGLPALRFDYYGVGDSEGNFAETTPSDWIGDVVTAARELRAIAGVRRIRLVGVRLGGTIAALAAPQIEGFQRLVLWDPVVDGQAYLAQLHATHRRLVQTHAWASDLGAAAQADLSGAELVGYPVSQPLVDGIAGLRFPDWSDILVRAGMSGKVVLGRESFGYESLVEPREEVRVVRIDFDCNWTTHTVAVLYPQSIIDALLDEN